MKDSGLYHRPSERMNKKWVFQWARIAHARHQNESKVLAGKQKGFVLLRDPEPEIENHPEYATHAFSIYNSEGEEVFESVPLGTIPPCCGVKNVCVNATAPTGSADFIQLHTFFGFDWILSVHRSFRPVGGNMEGEGNVSCVIKTFQHWKHISRFFYPSVWCDIYEQRRHVGPGKTSHRVGVSVCCHCWRHPNMLCNSFSSDHARKTRISI